MSNIHKNSGQMQQSGNAVIPVLIVLAVLAVGGLAFMSGKIGPNGAITASSSTEAKTYTASADNPVVAKVSGGEITRQEVLDFISAMPANMQQLPPQQLFPMAMEQVINNKVVANKIDFASMENNPEVQQQLAIVKDQLIRAKFVENEVEKQITEDKIRAKYDEYVKNVPDVEEVHAAHILVEKEDKAKELVKKLDAGESFEQLAKDNSKDGTASTGGDVGYFTKTEVVPEFADAAFATAPGSYTKAPVKSAFGYHIIKVLEKRKRPAADFEAAKPYLEAELRRSLLDETLTKWQQEASIERFDINGKPLAANAEGTAPTATSEAAPQATEPQAAPDTAPAAGSTQETATPAESAPAAEPSTTDQPAE